MIPKLTILGCSDAFNADGRFHTCFLLEGGERKFLIDCGASSLQQIKAKTLTTNQIDGIIITHFHGDHFAGLPFFLMDAARVKRTRPLHIFSPTGGKDLAFNALKLFYPGKESILETLPLTWHEYQTEKIISGPDVQVQAFEVEHSAVVKPHALRVMFADKIVSYSGDTKWTNTLVKVAKNADVFLCDCTFFRSPENNHLNYTTLEKHRDELDCKRLILTHFDEEMLENASEVQEEMAYDGQEIQL